MDLYEIIRDDMKEYTIAGMSLDEAAAKAREPGAHVRLFAYTDPTKPPGPDWEWDDTLVPPQWVPKGDRGGGGDRPGGGSERGGVPGGGGTSGGGGGTGGGGETGGGGTGGTGGGSHEHGGGHDHGHGEDHGDEHGGGDGRGGGKR